MITLSGLLATLTDWVFAGTIAAFLYSLKAA